MRKTILLCLSAILTLAAHAQSNNFADSVRNLNEVVVRGSTYTQQIKSTENGKLELRTDALMKMPKIMGNSDPLRMIQTTPGVHTNNEYDTGVNIEGSESYHNTLYLDGVPLYGVTHLLGFFSIFNTPHFTTLSVNKNAFTAANQRLGASINCELGDTLTPYLKGKNTSAELAVGLMSAQGTFRQRLSPKMTLLLSARQSFVNLLYSSFLKMDEMAMNYDFGDYNATLLYQPAKSDFLKLNFYTGHDDMAYDNYDRQLFRATVGWRNTAVALDWNHYWKEATLKTKAYLTDNMTELNLKQESKGGDLEQGIREIGAKSDFSWKNFSAGIGSSYFDITPQTVEYKNVFDRVSIHDKFWLLNAHVQQKVPFGNKHNFHLILKANHYRNADYKNVSTVDPIAGLTLQVSPTAQFNLDGGMLSQYLAQTGEVIKGAPSDYWMSIRESRFEPQQAYGVNASFSKKLMGGDYQFDINAYYKKLTNQVEYRTTPLDLLSEDNGSKKNYILCSGYNWGFSAQLHKRTGKLTGWLSYSFQRSRRSTDDPTMPHWFSSRHERPHEINALAMYTLNDKWDFCGTFVLASGTPFTASKEMYFTNGQVMVEYGEYNANRLPTYYRLDLSANWTFKRTKKLEHMLNFSLYNATLHENALFYSIKFERKDRNVKYNKTAFAIPIVPSISYHLKF